MGRGVTRLGGLIFFGIAMVIAADDAASQGARGGFPSEAEEARNIATVRSNLRKLEDLVQGPRCATWKSIVLDSVAGYEDELRAHPGITPQRRAELITEARRLANRLRERNCDQPTATAGTPFVTVDSAAGGQTIKLPRRSFLGFEPLGAPAPTLGLVQPSSDASGPSGKIEIKVDPGYGILPSLRFSLSHSEADTSQFFPVIDPGAGNRIVLPGPLGGASGVSAGGHPLNIGSDTSWRYENKSTTASVDLDYRVLPDGRIVPSAGSINRPDDIVMSSSGLTISVGAFYGRDSSGESFSGSIPGLGREFAYTTNVDVDRVGVRVGFDTAISFFDTRNLSHELRFGAGYREPPSDNHWAAALRFGGEISGVHLSASGQDYFTFTGVPSSSAPLDTTATKFGYGLRGGVELRNQTGLVFGMMTSYESAPGYGVVERDGNNPSRFVFKNADVFKVTGGVRFPLGGIGWK